MLEEGGGQDGRVRVKYDLIAQLLDLSCFPAENERDRREFWVAGIAYALHNSLDQPEKFIT